MSQEALVIRCHCQHGAWGRVVAVLLLDGRLEMRQDGKSSTVSGGRVLLSCRRCGFETEIALDAVPGVAVA